MLNFDEIEDCFPEHGAFCLVDGRVAVSAQWLHDFAHAVAAKERMACSIAAEAEKLECPTDSEGDQAYDTAIEHVAKAIRMRSNAL